MGDDLQEFTKYIEDMMSVVKDCNERLDTMALRPNPLSMTEHIDFMIQTEKLQKKSGFIERIQILNEIRKRAEIPKSSRKSTYTCALQMKAKIDRRTILERFGHFFSISSEFISVV